MSKFLRDQYVRNINLNSERLRAISGVFVEIAQATNLNLPLDDPQRVSVNYLIRFDNKGFVLDDFDAVLNYHNSAKRTERVNFSLVSEESRQSNSLVGKRIELRFDALNEGNCTLTVQDDDSAWTDATYCRLDEELVKYGNRNYLIRSAWTPFAVQIFGVVAGFFLSLWVALRISPKLTIDYALIVSFVLAFLVFSNVWTYLNQRILALLDIVFPNISLKESKGLHWLGKAFVSALFVAAAFYILNALLGFVGSLISEILA